MHLAIEIGNLQKDGRRQAKTSVIHPHYEGLKSVKSDQGTQTIKINVDCSLPQTVTGVQFAKACRQ